MSFVDLGYARVDTDRERRCGFPEVVFGAGKTPEQVVGIAEVIIKRHGVLLVSRVEKAHFEALHRVFPDAQWHALARCASVVRAPAPVRGGVVGVICAGTSDLPVAEEDLQVQEPLTM